MSARSGSRRCGPAHPRPARPPRKTFRHPVRGRITVDCDHLEAVGSDLRLVMWTAPPGSPDANALKLLGVIGSQKFNDPSPGEPMPQAPTAAAHPRKQLGWGGPPRVDEPFPQLGSTSSSASKVQPNPRTKRRNGWTSAALVALTRGPARNPRPVRRSGLALSRARASAQAASCTRYARGKEARRLRSG